MSTRRLANIDSPARRPYPRSRPAERRTTRLNRFEYFEPATLAEAVALLGRCNGKASLLAGGTDLLVEIKEHLRRPDYVINIKQIPGMEALGYDAKRGLRFGALVTSRAIELSPVVQEKYPGLAQAVRDLGSIQVRNRATVVGNICRASPSADTLPPLIADGASARIYGPGGERVVLLEEFFTGPGQTVLKPDELVTEITIPPPPPRTGKDLHQARAPQGHGAGDGRRRDLADARGRRLSRGPRRTGRRRADADPRPAGRSPAARPGD